METMLKSEAINLVRVVRSKRKEYEMPFTGGCSSDDDEAKADGWRQGFQSGQDMLRAAIIKALEAFSGSAAMPKALVNPRPGRVFYNEKPKTMYDQHVDAEGNSRAIFEMGDAHLVNTIEYKVKRFVAMRDSASPKTDANDPCIAAMSSAQKWTNIELMARTQAILGELNPFIQEALTRNSTVIARAANAIKMITGRSGRVTVTTVPLIEESIAWDSFATAGNTAPDVAQ